MQHVESHQDVMYYRICSITFPGVVDIRQRIAKVAGVVFVHKYCIYAHIFVRTLEWVYNNRILFSGQGATVNRLLREESVRLSALPRSLADPPYNGEVSPF